MTIEFSSSLPEKYALREKTKFEPQSRQGRKVFKVFLAELAFQRPDSFMGRGEKEGEIGFI